MIYDAACGCACAGRGDLLVGLAVLALSQSRLDYETVEFQG